MKYAGIIYDDTAAAPGLSLSLYIQGCPLKCPGCHNQDMWDFEGGYEFSMDTTLKILEALNANGILRNLCILGGEPLTEENYIDLGILLKTARKMHPSLNIYIWTGYTFEELCRKEEEGDAALQIILDTTDVLITGRYEQEKRDITLKMRGSTNQAIYVHHREEGSEEEEERVMKIVSSLECDCRLYN